jgi:hypothetical protein
MTYPARSELVTWFYLFGVSSFNLLLRLVKGRL